MGSEAPPPVADAYPAAVFLAQGVFNARARRGTDGRARHAFCGALDVADGAPELQPRLRARVWLTASDRLVIYLTRIADGAPQHLYSQPRLAPSPTAAAAPLGPPAVCPAARLPLRHSRA